MNSLSATRLYNMIFHVIRFLVFVGFLFHNYFRQKIGVYSSKTHYSLRMDRLESMLSEKEE